jgi:hypothetical protein
VPESIRHPHSAGINAITLRRLPTGQNGTKEPGEDDGRFIREIKAVHLGMYIDEL